MRVEQSPYSQMSLGARFFRNERIGRFLYAVVHKPIGVLRADDQFQLESFPKCCFGLLFGRLKNSRKRRGFRRYFRCRQVVGVPFES